MLEAMGYRVLRFTNQQVLYETAAVLVRIRAALTPPAESAAVSAQLGAALTPPAPSPEAGEGEPNPQRDPHSSPLPDVCHTSSAERRMAQASTSVPPLPQAGEGDRG